MPTAPPAAPSPAPPAHEQREKAGIQDVATKSRIAGLRRTAVSRARRGAARSDDLLCDLRSTPAATLAATAACTASDPARRTNLARREDVFTQRERQSSPDQQARLHPQRAGPRVRHGQRHALRAPEDRLQHARHRRNQHLPERRLDHRARAAPPTNARAPPPTSPVRCRSIAAPAAMPKRTGPG